MRERVHHPSLSSYHNEHDEIILNLLVTEEEASGGETACWAHLVCLDCGSLISDGLHTHDPHLASDEVLGVCLGQRAASPRVPRDKTTNFRQN